MNDVILDFIKRQIDQAEGEILENSGESHSEQDTQNYLNGYLDALVLVRDVILTTDKRP